MPKDTPKMAGTMMKTRSRVNHTVKEMPSRIHNKLSKGLKKSSILKLRWDCLFQIFQIVANRRQLNISWPQMAFMFCQSRTFMKVS